MSETLKEAATYIEQGHVRVGPHAVTDPAVREWVTRGLSMGIRIGCLPFLPIIIVLGIAFMLLEA